MEANNPYDPPAAPSLPALGSLAQAARGNELKQAQRILIGIGVLTLVVNGFLLFNLPNEIQQALNQNQIAPENVETFRQEATISGYLIYGLPVLLGCLFVIFGSIIKQYPVPITITSLVLYVLATAAFGLLAPETLVQGFIMKIIIVYALIRAIKAARAYRDHTQAAIFGEGTAG